MSSKELELAELKARQETMKECIRMVINGRTMTNFGHVPSVVRALEWVWADLDSLQDQYTARIKVLETELKVA